MAEKIQIVDENDQPVKVATRDEAYANGWYYRLVRIILEDENGRLLLQKRSEQKKLYPGLWTDAASGHVDEGDTYETAAERELQEELGVNAKLEWVDRFLVEHADGIKNIKQFNGVFRGKIAADTPLTPQPEEVSDTRWVTIKELKEEIAEQLNNFTPGVRQVVERYY